MRSVAFTEVRWLSGKSFKRAYFVTLLLFLLVGVGLRLHLEAGAAQQLAPYVGSSLLVRGEVEPASVRQYAGYTAAIVRCEEVRLSSKGKAGTGELLAKKQLAEAGHKISYQNKLRVSVKGSLPTSGRVVLNGRLEELTSLRNPGGFDADLYNRLQGLGGRLSGAQLLAVQPGVSLWQQLELWRMALCAQLEKTAGKELGGILSGMLLGGSSRLEEGTRELFTANGMAHLLSVSGTHLLLLTSLLVALLKPVPRPWRQLLVIAVLALYAALCGLRPPVLRALLMCAALLVGGSGAQRGRLLCLVAVVLLLCKPLWLWDVGFQLSFTAAAGLVWLLPACKRLLGTRLPEPVSAGLAVTLSAQLAVLPVEASSFHQFSLVSLLSNLLLVPLLELTTQLALIGLLLPFGAYLVQLAAAILEQVLLQASWLAALPYSTLVVGELPAVCWLLYYTALALVADFSWLQVFSNKERYTAIFCCLSIVLGISCWQKVRTLPLTAYFLDVGQGDCAVVVTPAQRVVVIDTGGLRSLDTGSRAVAPFLRSLGYSRIDVLLLSHYDFDHVGGAPALLRQLQVKKLLLPKEEVKEEGKVLQQEILQQAAKGGVQAVEVAQSGMVLQLDAATQLVVLAVPKAQTSGNEASTLAAVRSAQGSLLFTGDMGVESEKELPGLGSYTVLKAGHHGSRYSTGSEFLAQVQPQLTVLSCGKGNRYGHPHAELLERVRAARSAVARTDEMGCVKVVFDERGGWSCYGFIKMRWQKLQSYNL